MRETEAEHMTNRKRQALESRRKIISASFKLASQKGLENLTIQDICAAADVSVGAFYHHFKSKESLVLAWYERVDGIFEGDVMPRLRAKDCSTADKLIEFFRTIAVLSKRNGADYISQLYRAQCTVANGDEYCAGNALPCGLLELIETGQKVGDIRDDLDAVKLRDSLLLIVRGTLLDWAWRGCSYDVGERMDEIVRPYLDAMSA